MEIPQHPTEVLATTDDRSDVINHADKRALIAYLAVEADYTFEDDEGNEIPYGEITLQPGTDFFRAVVHHVYSDESDE